ncbi:tetratricopeptide repeat protein [Candidatus Parcubacteria bacterium]|nr:tetratricopeptide repeat protein [Patescibacteria group bacterium]MCG2693860.1 tetratricopeptide repeat protein [Candidatus Parcubacteria bacterium]
MSQLLSNKTDSKSLQRAWDLDQKALFNKNKEQQRKLWSSALLICRKLLKKYTQKSPDYLQILSKIYLIYQHQQKFRLAKKYLDLAGKKSKDDPIVLFNYGNLYRAANKSQLAIDYYKKAIKRSNEEIFKNELARYREILKQKKLG